MAELTREEIYAWLDEIPQLIRVATVGKDGYPHMVPMNYFRLGDEIIVPVRGQREVNVRRNPKISLLLDEGGGKEFYKGVMITGDANVVDDPAEILELTRANARARGVAEAELPTEARRGRTFARVTPKKFATWDTSRR